ncbi:helix-turn-helix domain-containing protein [Candidatus Pacearchaeota archaeon]|nr:helix-turn-helix domain-containing protein [Candidatus Pacearchaeota archaeon]MBD3283139.1 helix-turn-helix domain-containing protein [Candidatus Pacearchaeota archaeon]
MVDKCSRCGVRGDRVRLFDAVYDGRMANLCERCSIIENIPIIRKPTSSQLRESEKLEVYERMKRLSGFRDFGKRDVFFREDRLKELDSNPDLEIPEKDKLNLIKHFHWEIMKNRRRKGLTQEKLAEILGESEVAIQMIEKGKIPENAEILIKKLEQLFQTRLRKIDINELLESKVEEKPVLLDEKGRVLDKIPEPEIKEEEIEDMDVDERDTGSLDRIDEEKSEKEKVKSDESEGVKSSVSFESEPEISFEEIDLEREPVECKTEKFDDYKTKIKCEKVQKEEPLEGDFKRYFDRELGRDFDVKKADLSSTKIADLKKLHEKKLKEIQMKKLEEEKRKKQLEEKRKELIEKRKKELNLMKKKESRELDNLLGGSELLGNKFKRKDSESL